MALLFHLLLRRMAGLTTAAAVILSIATGWTARADDSAGQANRLFVQAMQLLRQADSTLDAGEESRLLLEADKLLTEIITSYPDSTLAVQLVTSQYVGAFDFSEFRSRIKGLACTAPLSSLCFLHRIGEMLMPLENPITSARWDWLSLAVAYYHLGDPERAKEIITPFVGAVRRGAATDAAGEDLFVARALSLMNQSQLALEITRKISDCSTRIYNLADIAKAAAWRGETALAGQLAQEAGDYATAQGCIWEQGLVAQTLLRAGKETEARALFNQTVESQFAKVNEPRSDCCPPELVVAAADLGDTGLAFGMLRNIEDENPWTIPAVLGRVARRGETAVALAAAELVTDPDVRGEAYAELVEAAIRRSDRTTAEDVGKKLINLVEDSGGRRPALIAQQAKAEKLLLSDDHWRATFQQAVAAAERASNFVRRDVGGPLLAALLRIETGLPMLE
jgi:tetratricopeptide (TPR) repeat protein